MSGKEGEERGEKEMEKEEEEQIGGQEEVKVMEQEEIFIFDWEKRTTLRRLWPFLGPRCCHVTFRPSQNTRDAGRESVDARADTERRALYVSLES